MLVPTHVHMVSRMTDDPFQEQTESLRETIEEDEPPNVAVVAEPYAGRERVIQEATDRLDATAEAVDFSSVADAVKKADAFAGSEGTVVVGGCEYLYTRRIDGFEPLERFVEAVAGSEATVVSSWSSYAWSYAEQATDADDLFREVVRLPSVGARCIADHLASEYDVSEFESDLQQLEEEEPDTIEARVVERIPFDVWRLFYEESENFFERITALSGGNPGVARAVFESRSWEADDDEDDRAELSYEDAFALRVVLSKETVERGVIESVVEPRSLEKSLRRLSDAGLVELDGERVSLRPENLVDTVDHLGRRRLLW